MAIFHCVSVLIVRCCARRLSPTPSWYTGNCRKLVTMTTSDSLTSLTRQLLYHHHHHHHFFSEFYYHNTAQLRPGYFFSAQSHHYVKQSKTHNTQRQFKYHIKRLLHKIKLTTCDKKLIEVALRSNKKYNHLEPLTSNRVVSRWSTHSSNHHYCLYSCVWRWMEWNKFALRCWRYRAHWSSTELRQRATRHRIPWSLPLMTECVPAFALSPTTSQTMWLLYYCTLWKVKGKEVIYSIQAVRPEMSLVF